MPERRARPMTRSRRRRSVRTLSSAARTACCDCKAAIRLRSSSTSATSPRAHAGLVQGDDLVEAGGVLARQCQVLLRQLQIDERLLARPASERSNGIEDLRRGDRAIFRGDGVAPVAFAAAFKQEVHAHAVLGRTRAVDIVEAGPSQVQVVAPRLNTGFGRSRPSPDWHRRQSRRIAWHQLEVAVERFRDGLVKREVMWNVTAGGVCAATTDGGTTSTTTTATLRRTGGIAAVSAVFVPPMRLSETLGFLVIACALSVRITPLASTSSGDLHGRRTCLFALGVSELCSRARTVMTLTMDLSGPAWRVAVVAVLAIAVVAACTRRTTAVDQEARRCRIPGGCYVLVYEQPRVRGSARVHQRAWQVHESRRLAISRELAAADSKCPGWASGIGHHLGRRRIAGSIADAVAGQPTLRALSAPLSGRVQSLEIRCTADQVRRSPPAMRCSSLRARTVIPGLATRTSSLCNLPSRAAGANPRR